MRTIKFDRVVLLHHKMSIVLARYKPWLTRSLKWLIVITCLTYLLFNARQLQQYRGTLHVNAGHLFLSALLTLVALWLGVAGWGLVLRAVGIRLPWPRVAWIHLSSNLAKYLPGYGWQLVGKAYLTRQAGVSARTLSALMLGELAIVLFSGAAIAAVVALQYDVAPTANLRLLILGAGLVATALIVVLPLLLPFFCERIWGDKLTVSTAIYGLAVAVIAVGWIIFGIAFWFLGAGLTLLSPGMLPYFLFAIVGSFWISLIVLVVPAGIGVRESIMVLLLSPVVGPTPAVMIALVSRLLWLGSELFAAWTARLWFNSSETTQ
jgi:uncharacterized membrane protein YbhN (UPF0104 family)